MALGKQVGKLHDAQERGEVIEVRRSIRRADRLRGYVAGLGKRWLLLQLVEDVTVNGYAAIRIRDIDKVRYFGRKGSFILRALDFNGATREPIDNVDLSGLSGVLAGLSEHFPLVSVYTERDLPDACYIGRVGKVTERSVTLHEIDTEAKWIPKPTRWKFVDITRIDAGGDYEQALAALAEDRE